MVKNFMRITQIIVALLESEFSSLNEINISDTTETIFFFVRRLIIIMRNFLRSCISVSPPELFVNKRSIRSRLTFGAETPSVKSENKIATDNRSILFVAELIRKIVLVTS